MGNTFTALAPTLFSVAQEVSNEPFGVVNSITTSFNDKGVAKGDFVTVPIAPVLASGDFTPAAVSTSGADAIASSVKVQITQSKKVTWHLTGEQIQSLANADSDREWVRQMVAQGMRTLRNLAEADAAVAVKVGASRAYGTATTNPFATNLDPLVEVRQILFDNGAPMADLQLVVNSAAGTALRKLGIIQQAYQAGSEEERRSGKLLRQYGFQIGESAGIVSHTKGTGTLYVTNGSTATGVTDIAMITGTNNVLAGDVVTFAADTANKYVVNTGIAAPGTISLGRPGARVTIGTSNALTVGATYTPNLAFERSSVVGVFRPPIVPYNATIQQIPISDGAGLTYLLLEIQQYGQTTWELHLAYGTKVVQSEHVAILLG